jgi:Protein of unknown function DUF262
MPNGNNEVLEVPEFEDDPGDESYQPNDVPLDREVITTPYDAPVRTLLEEIREKTLIVNPPFQRQNIWDKGRQSRLLESLLLNIPIPVLYFAEDEDGTRVVVDGQQRLRAIEEFHTGQYNLQKLEVLALLNGKRWTDLTPKQARTILARTLRCVVISANSPPTLRFEMFERLNTGGMPLNDQELRNCVFRGDLNDLLNEIVHGPAWLGFIDRAEPDARMRHHELVVRFFAIETALDRYRPPLKAVLNEYMKAHRNLTTEERATHKARFERAFANVRAVFGAQSFRRHKGGDAWDGNLNRAVFDVQMLSLAERTPDEVGGHAQAVLNRFKDLCLHNPDFADALSRATADRSRLYLRLRIWGRALEEEGIAPGYLNRLPNV